MAGNVRQRNMDTKRLYLVRFTAEFADFRLNEVDSIIALAGDDPTTSYIKYEDNRGDAERKTMDEFCTCLVLSLTPRAASALASRCALVRLVVELWGEGGQDAQAAATEANSAPSCQKAHCFQPDASFSLEVSSSGRKIRENEANDLRRAVAWALPFQGSVNLSTPDNVVVLFEGKDGATTKQKQRSEEEDGAAPISTCWWYLGLKIDINVEWGPRIQQQCSSSNEGQRQNKLATISGYKLSNVTCLPMRAYLGPTSMNSRLSVIMSNMAQVKCGSVVLDPFVGTGSILVPASTLGAMCIGMDIDGRILAGKDGKNIVNNFQQYRIREPEILKGDMGCYCGQWRDNAFDAVICDPPYGDRAAAKHAGLNTNTPASFDRSYALADIMCDILDMSARILRIGGRLVYLLPSSWDFDPLHDVPGHLCLDLVAISTQGLTFKQCRHVITMEKVTKPVPPPFL